MITGIIDYDSFSKVGDTVKIGYVELLDSFNQLKEDFEQERKYCLGNDLNFLFDKYEEEFSELEKINTKVQNYYFSLTDLLVGYKSQQEEIVRSINLYLKKLEKEIK